ncbi:MAG: hypothetical protein LBF38_08180 [Deltaproteobacteria bacterium]|jgi:hypothetical protein|nr:hypothetical protein [Deltaproteobacteria bacterium]
MKTFFSLTITIFCLVIFAFSPAAHGQGLFDEPFYGLKPTISPRLPNFRYTTLLGVYKNKCCPNFSNDVGFTYPVNTGSGIFDDFLVGYAKNIFNEYAQYDLDYGEFETSGTLKLRTTFTAEIAGENYLSIMFTSAGYYIGAAHDYTNSTSFIFDLKNQKFLELSDIFVNPKQSIPLLWPLVANGWCQLNLGENIPFEYDIPLEKSKCGQATPPTPASFLADYVPFKALGTVILDRSGMVIRLEFPFARGFGPQKITISREALIRLGAKPEIWQ